MRATDLAYLAGVVDADGYVTATMSTRRGATYFGAQVGITGSCRAPHDLAAALFGGTVSSHSPGRGREHHRRQFHWQLGGRRAVPAIEAVLPYLRIKHLRARLVLELQETVDEIRDFRLALDDPAPWMPAGWDPTPSLRVMVEEIRACTGGEAWARLSREDTAAGAPNQVAGGVTEVMTTGATTSRPARVGPAQLHASAGRGEGMGGDDDQGGDR